MVPSNLMNALALRTAGKYLGAWGAIVLCVVLLSCLFTFLGTITCAVLVGMMLGAFKGARWFAVAASLVFPGVIFGMVRGARVELTSQQVIVLAGLCFGVFWATYLVSAFLFFCEQKGKRSARHLTAAAELNQLAVDPPVAATGCTPLVQPIRTTVPARESFLEQLQGEWVRDAAGASKSVDRSVIQITETRLELKALDGSGRITLLATGDVTLQSTRASCNSHGVA